jgi:hypothetical protein
VFRPDTAGKASRDTSFTYQVWSSDTWRTHTATADSEIEERAAVEEIIERE